LRWPHFDFLKPSAPPGEILAVISPRIRSIWVLWGCGGMVSLLLLAMGSCLAALKPALEAGEKEFTPAVERYLARVRAHDYRGAYADFGGDLHQALSELDYVALEAGMHQDLGPLRTRTRAFLQAGADAEGAWGLIVYQCAFERGPGTLSFTLRKEVGAWRIESVKYDSPAFLREPRSRTGSPSPARPPAPAR
jgi:hypothetical protein